MTGEQTPVLTGRRVTVRPVEAADLETLAAILREPSVARWWPDDPDDTARELVTSTDSCTCAILLEGTVVGCVQWYEENEPGCRHAALDMFVATAHQGRGLGPEALRLAARHLFAARGHHRLVIDPRVDNGRAIRAYERVGFRPVGVMREYERGSDGVWHDGLLMDLLRDELDDEPVPDAG